MSLSRSRVIAGVAVATFIACSAWAATCLRAQRRKRCPSQVVIEELWVFPVKGCRGVRQRTVVLNQYGLEFDREWVILKEDTKRTTVTLRNCQKLSLVHTELDRAARVLRLTHRELGSITVPLWPPTMAAGDAVRWEIWDMAGGAIYEGDTVAAWLTQICGTPVGLYRIVHPRDPRDDLPKAALVPPDSAVLGQDFSSVMVLSRQTVEQVRRECKDDTVNPHRFRANVLVSVPRARDEEMFREMQSNGVRLRFTHFCARCSVPAVRDDGTFHPNMEPTRTLRRLFSGRQPHNPSGASEPFAGINTFHDQAGELREGDVMSIITTGLRPELGPATETPVS
jgi:uncharacterized protein YcbX